MKTVLVNTALVVALSSGAAAGLTEENSSLPESAISGEERPKISTYGLDSVIATFIVFMLASL
jgi:hypothetical protein